MSESTATIALLNMKGGVGKTTLSVNLAWHAFRFGKNRVLLVDLDPQFNASQYMMDFEDYAEHVDSKGTIASLLIEQPQLTLKKPVKRPKVDRCIFEVDSGPKDSCLHLLPSHLALSHIVKNPHQMESKLERLLAPLHTKYDYIFIDCAPTDSVLTTMALACSKFILVPMRPDRFSILGFGNLLETVEQFRRNTKDPSQVQELGLVFTQVNNSPAELQCMREIQTEADVRDFYIFKSKLKFSQTFVSAVQNQTPAFETKWAREDLKESVHSIVEEMEQRIEELSS